MTASKKEKEHMAKVAALGCVVCSQMGIPDSPAECHHIRSTAGAGQRSSHYEVIGLCPVHHRTGGLGIALHAGQKTWEKEHGTEAELLAQVERLLE